MTSADLMLIASAGSLPSSVVTALRRADRIRRRSLRAADRVRVAMFSAASRGEVLKSRWWAAVWSLAELQAFGGRS